MKTKFIGEFEGSKIGIPTNLLEVLSRLFYPNVGLQNRPSTTIVQKIERLTFMVSAI